MRKNIAMEQNGRSMIEMLGVLAIVGVLSVAGIAGYSKAMGKFKINKALDQVSTISANIKTLYGSIGVYNGLTTDVAYNLGVFPEDMTKSCIAANSSDATDFLNALIRSAYAANTSIATKDCIRSAINGKAGAAASADGYAFNVEFDGVSKDACVAFVSSDWGGTSGFRKITVTGGTKTIEVTPNTDIATAFNSSANCNACGVSSCTVVWEFL